MARTTISMMWTVAGVIAFAVGVVGAFLPLLPTVPLMLLAAFCFARGSERFHNWLVEHPQWGAGIRDWREHRSIRPRAKRAAVVAIVASFGLSWAFAVPTHVLAIQAVTLLAVLVFILTRPSGAPAPEALDTAPGSEER